MGLNYKNNASCILNKETFKQNTCEGNNEKRKRRSKWKDRYIFLIQH